MTLESNDCKVPSWYILQARHSASATTYISHEIVSVPNIHFTKLLLEHAAGNAFQTKVIVTFSAKESLRPAAQDKGRTADTVVPAMLPLPVNW